MNANIISSGTPLEDVLPWTSRRARTTTTTTTEAPAVQTILVNDSSIECDGRFLLYLTATTALKDDNIIVDNRISTSSSSSSSRINSGVNSSSSGEQGITRILWLANGGWTTQLVGQALKKMSCPPSAIQQTVGGNSSSSSSSSNSTSSKKKLIQIRSLTQEIGQAVAQEPTQAFCAQTYIKGLYREIKGWWTSQSAQVLDSSNPTASINEYSPVTRTTAFNCCSCWLILDDVSALSALVGSRLTYAFVMQLQALSAKSKLSSLMLPFSIMIRCSLNLPQPSLFSTCWVGAGGSKAGRPPSDGDDVICWEQGLVEIADQVVDVIPMASGYSSNVHGRLVVTTSPRRAVFGGNIANNASSSPLVVNYCLTDSNVLAFRIIQSA
jgi:hypothetical protein